MTCLVSAVSFLEILYRSALKGAKDELGTPVKSEILTLKFPLASVVLLICFLIDYFDDPNSTSDTFFLFKGAYKPTLFWKICGIPFPTPET